MWLHRKAPGKWDSPQKLSRLASDEVLRLALSMMWLHDPLIAMDPMVSGLGQWIVTFRITHLLFASDHKVRLRSHGIVFSRRWNFIFRCSQILLFALQIYISHRLFTRCLPPEPRNWRLENREYMAIWVWIPQASYGFRIRINPIKSVSW